MQTSPQMAVCWHDGILVSNIMKTKQLLANSRGHWAKWLLIGSAIALIFSLYGYRLDSFISLSPIETATSTANQSLRAIVDDPVNLPYKLLDYVFLRLPLDMPAAQARAASVVLALGCALMFYMIIRRWYGGLPALFSALLFAPGGWLLQTGRFGSGLIMLTFMVLALIATYAWLSKDSQPSGRSFILYNLITSAALLVPGGLWFVLVLGIIMHRKLIGYYKAASWWQRFSSLLPAASAAAMLSLAIWHQPAQVWHLLGIPANLPEYSILAKQAVASISYLIARGPFIPEVWLAHTPVLDVATTVLLLLGAIVFGRRWSSGRSILLLAFGLLGVVMVTLHGAYALAFIVPVVYIIAATGLIYLIRQWYRIFPRNPFAHGLAALSVVGLLCAIGSYHTQRYFVAWRHSPDTLQAYQPAAGTPKAPELVQ